MASSNTKQNRRNLCHRCEQVFEEGVTSVSMSSRHATTIVYLCRPCLNDLRQLWVDFMAAKGAKGAIRKERV